MKRLTTYIKLKFRNLSMKTKLAVSFSVPVIVVFILLFSLVYNKISKNYSEQVLSMADHSYNQAVNFLENTIEYMTYVSNQIYYDGDLQRIVSSDNFHGDREVGEQYREYLVLTNIFASAERTDTIYRAGIYVPDDLMYSFNGYHFMKESELYGRSDYKDFIKGASRDQVFFTTSEAVTFPDLTKSVEIISLLRQIRSTDGRFASLCVEQVSIKNDHVETILSNADITESGLVYLINSREEIVSSSDREMLLRLKESNGLPDSDVKMEWKQWYANGKKYLVNTQALPKASWHLVAMLPVSEMHKQGRDMNSLIFIIALLVVIVVGIVAYLLAGYYVKRLNHLNMTIQKVQSGDFNISSSESGKDEIGKLLNNFTHMAGQLKQLMEEKYISGRAVQVAEMRALQAQINPHFLYNTLDLINWEAYDYGAPEIAAIAQNLAQFYRISLNKGRNILTIEEELNHVIAYVAIENFHFTNSIHLEIDVPEEIGKLACINIILQPFVENAIMHGIGATSSIQECNIRISAKREEKNVIICIKDDGMGIEKEVIEQIFLTNTYKNTHGYGVKNINSRLKLCYGEEYGVKFESVPGEETTVILTIPALTIEEAEAKLVN